MALWGLTDALASVPTWETVTESFVNAKVDATNDEIDLGAHSFETGDKVIYQSGTGAAGTGFTDGNTFFVGRLAGSTSEIQLYTTLANATTNDGTTGLKALTADFGDTSTLQSIPQDIYYVDTTEAVIESNIDKGLRSPGWWKFSTSDAAETFTAGTALTTVVIANTTGGFTCAATDIKIGDRLVVSGTFGGTGSIGSYADPTTYSVSAITAGTAPAVTGFTLTTTAGAALTTVAGTPTGVTYTPSIDTGVRYHAEHLCAIKTTGTNDTGVDGSDDTIVEG